MFDKFVWLTWWCFWQVCMTDLMFDKFVWLTWWCFLTSLYDWLDVWQVCMTDLMMFDKFVWLTWWCFTSLYDWLDVWKVCMTDLWCLTSLYLIHLSVLDTFVHGPLTRYVKLRVAHAPGMPGTFSPPPRVSEPDTHHGTCVTGQGGKFRHWRAYTWHWGIYIHIYISFGYEGAMITWQ